MTLTLAADDAHALIHVRDTGPGIPPELLASIFDPFTQAEQTLARSEGGLGLGLALVKGLVALHGGDVRAVSGGTERGADFVVTLPLAKPAGAADAAAHRGAGERAATPRRRVLVVDDNQDAADTLAQLVEMLGHHAHVAYGGAQAVTIASEDPPDVVLCDIGLPGMNGYEVARALRASGSREMKLFAVSGYAQPEDLAKAAEAGFDGHVAKPSDLETIARLLA